MSANAFEIPFWWWSKLKDEDCKKYVKGYVPDDSTGLSVPEAKLLVLGDVASNVSFELLRGVTSATSFSLLDAAYKRCSARLARKIGSIDIHWASFTVEVLSPSMHAMNTHLINRTIAECWALVELMRDIAAAVARIA
jgi:hypothetical protein